MLRYHKKVYMPIDSRKQLQDFTDRLNTMNWAYSRHCLDNLKYRAINLSEALNFIKGLKLEAYTIFEYYTTDIGDILKVCYRVKYSQGVDIILVVGVNKNIITIYSNIKEDKHFTLKKELYTRG